MSLQPGTRLGSYEVTAQIGAGGMGEVWLIEIWHGPLVKSRGTGRSAWSGRRWTHNDGRRCQQ